MISKQVFHESALKFLKPVRPFLDDPEVSEIVINGISKVYVERRGQLVRTEATFASNEALMAALRNIAQFVGKRLDEEHPILEARLPDGSRVAAVIPPVGPDGPHVAIRRFFKETLTVEELVKHDSMSAPTAETLRALIKAKLNILIAGGTGSGKTSLLNALSGCIPETERVVVIEDSKEVQLQRDHVVQLEARPADKSGRGAVTIRDLFRTTLRMRPDRVIVGEIRGEEALDIVQAMTSGHGGCMGTLHATHPRDALARLETMAMMGEVGLPLSALRAQIASGVQVILQVARHQDGTRKITHVSEVLGFDSVGHAYRIQDLFVRDYRGLDSNDRIVSTLVATNATPACIAQLREHGVELPQRFHVSTPNASGGLLQRAPRA